MAEARTALGLGTRVLTESGTAVVVALDSKGVKLRDTVGQVDGVPWSELTG